MSTRKVYGIYDTTVTSETLNHLILKPDAKYDEIEAKLTQNYESSIWENPDGSRITVYDSKKYVGEITWIIRTSTDYYNPSLTMKIVDFPYGVIQIYTVGQATGKIVGLGKLIEATSSSGAYWLTTAKENGEIEICTTDDPNAASFNPNLAVKKPFRYTGGKLQKGSSLLRTETSNSGLTEGPFMQGNDYRWRAYRGSDTIDPTAVTYSTNDLYPNEPVTITVTPVTPTYGGTVYYRYQYSINGGSTWTNLGSRTTDTSKTMTIPEGATQFRARVTASDGWGFTSTTPVLGANLGVSQLKAFATINALHRSGVKMYATVDGKIREITKGYATVDGVIHKMF